MPDRDDPADLDRFVAAQDGVYATALAELGSGRKRSHWMWFVFPQLRGLGHSRMSHFYGIADLDEARRYLGHDLLGPRLQECARAVLGHRDSTADAIFGPVDAAKLRSSATLFGAAGAAPGVFGALLDAFFDGKACRRTRDALR